MAESISTHRRLYVLDGLRFVAATAVLLYHYFFRGWKADGMSILKFEYLGSMFKYGYLGVDLFFMISGFVITLSIRHGSLGLFAISRFKRLYPVYWCCLLLTWISIQLYGSPQFQSSVKELFLNLTMFQNYFFCKSVDGVYWTLFVEMKFYIFIIGIYLFLRKRFNVDLNGIIIVWLVLSYLFLFFPENILAKLLDYIFILKYSSYFIAGMVLFRIRDTGLSLTMACYLLLSLFLSLVNAYKRIPIFEAHYSTEFSVTTVFLIISMIYIVMLFISTNRLESLQFEFLAPIGALTYPLYLLHQKIGFIVMNRLGVYYNKYWIILFLITIMIIVSLFIVKIVEPPLRKAIMTIFNLK